MNLFAYGSLIEPEVQARVFGCPRIGEIDWVADYGLEAIEREGVSYARAFPKEGGRLRGQRIALSEAELRTADLYGGDAYIRKVVTLESGARAWMYLRPE
jgi:hypothetical protein